MRIKLFILFVSTACFFQSRLLAQNENLIWYVGSQNWIMDFSNDSMATYEINRSLNMGGDNSSICNSAGQMFCYSNNTVVLNAEHDTILGKQNVCYSDDYLAQRQNSILLPSSDSNLVFFFGYCDLVFVPPNTNANYRPLAMNYSIIDKRLNNNSGGIYNGLSNVLAVYDTLVCTHLTACKHANGKDWWVLTREFYGDVFYRFLTTQNGVLGPWEQHIGPDNYTDNCVNSQSVFSPDGKTYVFSGYGALVYVFDFDRCTGELSNERWISTGATWGAMGVAISPNNRYLYISAQFYDHPITKLFQYDLKSANINQSKITIAASIDTGGIWEYQSAQIGFLQLAPDRKIYVTSFGGNKLHVINEPDSIGLACDFEYKEIGFYPDDIGVGSLPNHPNFSLGALPSYQAEAGNNQTITEGDTTQIGSTTVTGLLYSWQPAFNINNITIAQPFVFPDTTTTYVLTVTDTSGEYSCAVRQDSVIVFVTPKNQPEPPIIVPTLINVSQTEYFEILNLPEGNQKLEIFNYLGQVVYTSENYLNDWPIKKLSASLYLYRLILANGEVMKGKFVVVR